MCLCDRCKKNTATVLVESIVNGVKSQNHLCQECVVKLESSFGNIGNIGNIANIANISFDSFLKSFLETIVFGSEYFTKPMETNVNPVCGTCGQTYEEFMQTSRLGCADCYNVFRPQLEVLLKNIQGSNVHDGKIPSRAGSELLFKKELNNLKNLLRTAVQEEEYEKAAALRDKIRQLQKNNADLI